MLIYSCTSCSACTDLNYDPIYIYNMFNGLFFRFNQSVLYLGFNSHNSKATYDISKHCMSRFWLLTVLYFSLHNWYRWLFLEINTQWWLGRPWVADSECPLEEAVLCYYIPNLESVKLIAFHRTFADFSKTYMLIVVVAKGYFSVPNQLPKMLSGNQMLLLRLPHFSFISV